MTRATGTPAERIERLSKRLRAAKLKGRACVPCGARRWNKNARSWQTRHARERERKLRQKALITANKMAARKAERDGRQGNVEL